MTPDAARLREDAEFAARMKQPVTLDPATILALLDMIDRQRDALTEAQELLGESTITADQRKQWLAKLTSAASSRAEGERG